MLTFVIIIINKKGNLRLPAVSLAYGTDVVFHLGDFGNFANGIPLVPALVLELHSLEMPFGSRRLGRHRRAYFYINK